MVRRMNSIKISVFGLVGLILLGLSSCKTTRVVTTSAVKPISTNKLIRNVENNSFNYKHFSIKRMTCHFDNGKTRTSFKASIRCDKDKSITVMLSKINIPVARIWLTPDSVKFVNYLENNYFLDDYSYLSSMLNMDLSFETVRSIISNNMFSFQGEKRDIDNHDYESKIDSGFYVLESVKTQIPKRNNQRISDRKSARMAQKILPEAVIHQSVYIDSQTFKLRKIKMEDAANSRSLNIEFSDFATVDKQLYPGEILFHLVSPESNMELRMNLGGFSVDEEREIRFRVPEKFTRINHD